MHADGVVIAGLTLPTGSWGHVSARLAATAARADASRMSDLCMVLQRQARTNLRGSERAEREEGDSHGVSRSMWTFSLRGL